MQYQQQQQQQRCSSGGGRHTTVPARAVPQRGCVGRHLAN